MKTQLLKYISAIILLCLTAQKNFAQFTFAVNNSGVGSTTIRNGQTNIVLYGFNATQSSGASLPINRIGLTNTNNNQGYFTNAKLFYSTTGSYSSLTPLSGLTINFNGGTVDISGISLSLATNTTYSFFLVADMGVSYGTVPSSLKFNLANLVNNPTGTTYTNSTTAATNGTTYTIALPNITVTNLTSGLTTGTLANGQTDVVVFGFSVTVTGAVTANQFAIITATDAQSVFTNARLFRSTTSTNYPTGFGTSVATGAINATNTRFTYTETFPGATTTVNYFVLMDYTGTCPTPSAVQFTISNTQSPAFIIGPASVDYPSSNSIAGTNFNIAKTMNWVGGTSLGAFTDLNNFATICGGAPTAIGQYDIIQIGVNATNFTYSPVITGNTTVGRLIFGNTKSATFSINAGSVLTSTDGITLQNGASTTFSSAVGGGSISIPTTSASSSLNSSSTLTLTGIPLTNAGSFSIPTGSSLSSSSNLTNSGVITTSGTGIINIGGTTTNTGTINKTGSGTTTLSGAVTNNSGGTITNGNATGAITFGSTLSNSGALNPITGPITITGNLTNNSTGVITLGSGGLTLASTGATPSNAGSITGSGSLDINATTSFTNSGSMTISGGTTSIASTTFNNTSPGIVTYTGGTVNFDGAAQAINNTTVATGSAVFNDLIISGTGTKTLGGAGSAFEINSTGVVTVSGAAILATGAAKLTLHSDINGSGSIAELPATTSLTGTINAERFVQGGNINKRGYRVMSSPVYAASVTSGSTPASPYPGTTRVYSINFLGTGATTITSILTGAAGGGFTSTGNPTLYLFREDVLPSNSSFTAGNFKGITAINNTTAYSYGIVAKNSTTNVSGASPTYLPVGNGFLFFFRGNQVSPSTKTTAPFNVAPENVTFFQTGTPTTGVVTVQPWFTTTPVLSYTTVIANNVAPNNIRGYNLLGNPYPSAINWEKFNRNGASSSIYFAGTSASTTYYAYNVTSKNYVSYTRNVAVGDTTTTVYTGSNSSDGVISNMISMGQGFFYIASSSGTQTFVFREKAKVPQQVTSNTNLVKFLGIPVETGPQLDSYLRLVLSKDTDNTDAVVIALNSQNNPNFVENEDALDLGGNGALVSMSAMSADKINLSINRIPFPKKGEYVVPLLVDATTSGLYTIKRNSFNAIPNLYEVWLKDKFKKDSLDLRANPTYNFNIDKSAVATFGSDRFQIVIRQNPALGLKLLDFDGNKVSQGVQLSWITENEAGYTAFTVERSIDNGKTFEVVGGFISTNLGKYNLIDKTPALGLNQYRLKLDDINGTISYSKVVNLMYSNNTGNIIINNISIYPNPANSVINIEINPQTNAATYIINITNSIGLLIKSATSLQATWQGNIGNLLPGSYFVEVVNGATKAVIGKGKFTKI